MINIFSPHYAAAWLKKNIKIILSASIIIILATLYSMIFFNIIYAIHLRSNTQPYYYIHDGAIQIEEAVKMTLNGKNPYTENYFNTPLENWGQAAGKKWDNPALYHLAYLPFNILFSIPFFIIFNSAVGWFDERIVYIFSLIIFILTILKWPNKSLFIKALFLFFFIANPWFFRYFIEGRNDIFVISWIILSIYFLALKRINYSALFLALAAASKQPAWFLVPFYFNFLYLNEPYKHAFWEKIKKVFKKTELFFIASVVLIIPFVLWDIRSFIDDVFRYSTGSASHSYPISAESIKIGFQYLVFNLKLVKSQFDYWPFWIPQLIFGLPLLYILLKLQKYNNSLGQMIFSFFMLLMTFWLFSRFFNNNYLGFLIILFEFAIFLIISSNKSEKTVFDINLFKKTLKNALNYLL